MDARFSERDHQQQLPAWIRNGNRIYNESTFGRFVADLAQFFRTKEPAGSTRFRPVQLKSSSSSTAVDGSAFVVSGVKGQTKPRDLIRSYSGGSMDESRSLSSGDINRLRKNTELMENFTEACKMDRCYTEAAGGFLVGLPSTPVSSANRSGGFFSALQHVEDDEIERKIRSEVAAELKLPGNKKMAVKRPAPDVRTFSRQNSCVTSGSRAKLRIVSTADDGIGGRRPSSTGLSSSSASSSRSIKDQSIAYMKRIKRALSDDNYATITAALKRYHSDRQLEAVFQVLCDLFLDDRATHPLVF